MAEGQVSDNIFRCAHYVDVSRRLFVTNTQELLLCLTQLSAYHIFIINYRLFSSYYHLDESITEMRRKIILVKLLSCLGF